MADEQDRGAGLRAWRAVHARMDDAMVFGSGGEHDAIEAALVRESQIAERVRRPEVAEVFRALIAEQDGFTLTHAFRLKVANLLNRMDIELQEAREREAALVAALTKISAIRDSIVGMQGFNFSEHAYPLVATLGEVGFDGAGYKISAANHGTLIEQAKAAEAERDTALAKLAKAEERAAAWREYAVRLQWSAPDARDLVHRARAKLVEMGEVKP